MFNSLHKRDLPFFWYLYSSEFHHLWAPSKSLDTLQHAYGCCYIYALQWSYGMYKFRQEQIWRFSYNHENKITGFPPTFFSSLLHLSEVTREWFIFLGYVVCLIRPVLAGFFFPSFLNGAGFAGRAPTLALLGAGLASSWKWVKRKRKKDFQNKWFPLGEFFLKPWNSYYGNLLIRQGGEKFTK